MKNDLWKMLEFSFTRKALRGQLEVKTLSLEVKTLSLEVKTFSCDERDLIACSL
ncbi:MAG TPA: hypothetical protein VEH06_09610 [Candidatus Bathyarchaeia archaeon]|nr:hypothetical protein [Candidatus Bathyarchaeia archaeon]